MNEPNTCGYSTYLGDMPICRLECKPCDISKCAIDKSNKSMERLKALMEAMRLAETMSDINKLYGDEVSE